MPRIEPEKLRPYTFHGVEADWREGDEWTRGDCPICGRSGKFGVELATGRFKCLKCSEVGNAYNFLRWLWDASMESTRSEDYDELALDRKILHSESLIAWQLCKSRLTGEWLSPGYGEEGKLQQLYRYARVYEGDDRPRMALLPTPTLGGHRLFGVDLYSTSRGTVWLCEGLWDAVALWEALGMAKLDEGRVVRTSSRESSLLADASVLATPSASIFKEEWAALFAGKRVNLCFDSDHPRDGADGAGYAGMKRVAETLLAAGEPPASVSWIKWGPDGCDRELPTGFDVRDLLCR